MMSKKILTILVCLLFTAAQIHAQPTCLIPPKIHASIAPNTTLTYQFMNGWTSMEKMCIRYAFDVWTVSLYHRNIHFIEVHNTNAPDITITKHTLDDDLAGAISATHFNAQGNVSGFGIVVTSDTTKVGTCDGYYKIVLHELGHGLGLGHTNGMNESSVMNMLGGPNDKIRNVARYPTECDIRQISDETSSYSQEH